MRKKAPALRKKDMGKALTDSQVRELIKLLTNGHLEGYIKSFRGNYYFIQPHYGTSKNNDNIRQEA